MRIPRKVIWLLFFLGATFAWIIFFQYGTDPHRFLTGAREELGKILVWLGRMIGRKA